MIAFRVASSFFRSAPFANKSFAAALRSSVFIVLFPETLCVVFDFDKCSFCIGNCKPGCVGFLKILFPPLLEGGMSVCQMLNQLPSSIAIAICFNLANSQQCTGMNRLLLTVVLRLYSVRSTDPLIHQNSIINSSSFPSRKQAASIRVASHGTYAPANGKTL